MKIFKRALQSTINLRKRTLILGLLFLLVMTFLITSASLQTAMNNILEKNQENVNPLVSIEMDLDLMTQEMFSQDNDKDKGREQIDKTLVEKVKASKYVKDFSVYADARTQSENNDLNGAVYDNDNPKVAKNNIKLLEGKAPVDSKEKNPILLPASYAKEKKFKVGDKVKLDLTAQEDKENKKYVDLTVSGIYQLTADNSDIAKQQEDTTFLTNPKVIDTINDVQYGKGQSMLSPYSKIKIELKNSKDTEKFISEIQNKGGDFTGILFNSSYNEFKSISKMIDNLTDLFSMLKIIILIVAAVIISLIMLLSLRERKYEIGLLLSLGERKISIFMQMFIEVALLLIVSTVISFAVANFAILPKATDSLNEKMALTMSENEKPQMPRGNNFEEDSSVKLDAQTEIDKEDIGNNNREVTLIFLIILGITGLSTIIPTMRITSKSPKSILTSTE